MLIARYSLMRGFDAEASGAVLDLAGDDDNSLRAKRNVMRWDVKKKKYVKAEADGGNGGDNNKKRIKTESGVWIPASYKSDRYAKWKERSKLAQMQEEQEQQDEGGQDGGGARRGAKRNAEIIYTSTSTSI